MTFDNPTAKKRHQCASPGSCLPTEGEAMNHFCQGLLHHQDMCFSRTYAQPQQSHFYYSFVSDYLLFIDGFDETSLFYTKIVTTEVFQNAAQNLFVVPLYYSLHHHCTSRWAEDSWAKQSTYCSSQALLNFWGGQVETCALTIQVVSYEPLFLTTQSLVLNYCTWEF